VKKTKASTLALPKLLLTVHEVGHLLGVSARAVWRMVEEGRFPAPRKYSHKMTRWLPAEVRAWAKGVWRKEG
jgi:predicted DNA-binding transcriptional regulator AlpA